MNASENELSVGSGATFTEKPLIPRGREKLYHFWQTAQDLGLTTLIDARRVRIIEAFISPEGPSLNDLRGLAGVTTREGVRQIIDTGAKIIRNAAPDKVQEEYSQEDLLNFRVPARPISERPQRVTPKVDPAEAKKHRSDARIKLWKDSEYRAKVMAKTPTWLGREIPVKTRKKISKSMTGRQVSDDTRTKLAKKWDDPKYKDNIITKSKETRIRKVQERERKEAERQFNLRVVRFIVDGNLDNFPQSFFEVLYREMGTVLIDYNKQNIPVITRLRNANEVLQAFSAGLNVLTSEAKNPKLEAKWDNETVELWDRFQARALRYGGRGKWRTAIRNRLIAAERHIRG